MAGPQRVLIVDEDQYLRDTIRDALVAEGFACDVAATVSEAEKAIEDAAVACAVLDVSLAEGDVPGLLRQLQRQSPALRVIALATPADQEWVLAALRAGACDYLAKPIHDEELCLAVGRALAVHAIQVQAEETRQRLARIAAVAAEIERAGIGEEESLALVRHVTGALEGEDPILVSLFAAAARARSAPAETAPTAKAPESPSDADAGEAELLREVIEGMTREVDPARLLAASLRPVGRATGARVVSLYLIENIRGCLVREAQWEGTDGDRPDLPRDLGLTGGSLQSGAIVATEHPERDPRFVPDVDTPESGVPGPLLVIPLRVRDRVLGVARVFPGPDAPASPRLGELLAAPLSAATRNVLLYRSLLESVEDVARARREAESGTRNR